MMKWFTTAALLVLTAGFVSADDARFDRKFDKHRQAVRDTTVTLHVEGGRGTGNVVSVDKNGNTWILTAAHVTEGSKTVKVAVVERDDDGEVVSETYHHADVMVETLDEDLALLRLRSKKNLGFKIVQFSNKKPKLDETVALCGTVHGVHERVITTGRVQAFNTKGIHKKTVYDMATLSAHRGCSGGGIWNVDGKYVGMFVALSSNNIGYYIPMHRIQKWAKENKVDFLFDPKAKVPELKPLERTPKHSGVITIY